MTDYKEPERLFIRAFLLAVLLSGLLSGLIWLIVRAKPYQESFLLYGQADHRIYIWNYYVWVVGLPLFTVIAGLHFLRRASYGVKSFDLLPTITAKPNRFSKSASVVFWAVVSSALYGPPWGIGSGPISLNNHETVHFKGIQAIFSGAQPYIGSASSQYGPLNQLAASLYMKYLSSETLAGNREYWAAINFVGLAVILLIVAITFSPKSAFIINCTLLVWPAFNFFALKPNGLDGFFGWPNPLRYLCALIIPLALVHRQISAGIFKERILIIVAGLAVGFLWLYSQENLIVSITVIPLVILVQVAHGKAHFREALLNCLMLVFSALIFVGLYLVPYVLRSNLKSFLNNYFLIPRAVISGYANFDYQLIDNLCCDQNRQYLPFFVWTVLITGIAGLLIAYLLIVVNRNLDSQNRGQFVSLFCLWAGSATVLSGAFTSMGATRVIATSIILPIWLVHLCVLCWRHFAKPWWRALGAVVLILTVLLGSYGQFGRFSSSVGYENVIKTIGVRVSGFSAKTDPPMESPFKYSPDLTRLSYERLVGWLTRMNRESTYLDPIITPVVGDELGLYYFVADLVPYPVPFDEQTMVITSAEEKKNLKVLSDPNNQLCNLVTSDLESSSVDAASKSRNFFVSSSIYINGQQLFQLQNQTCR